MKRAIPYTSVPRILPNGGTVLVIGSGPSLTARDVELCLGRVDAVIAVNDAYKLIPDATCLYAGDLKWWNWHHGAEKPHIIGRVKFPAFTGQFKYTMLVHGQYYAGAGVQVLRRGPGTGLSTDPTSLATGYNSVYQAVNIAAHFGGTRVLLLGVDMQGGSAHFFGRHPDNSAPPFSECLKAFATLIEPLAQAGISIINCTRSTALQCFPRQSLEDALCPPLSLAG